jgi:hypothetical protein
MDIQVCSHFGLKSFAYNEGCICVFVMGDRLEDHCSRECLGWSVERRIARVLDTYGHRHLSGTFVGMITFTASALELAVRSIDDWLPIYELFEMSERTEFQLDENLFHADALGATLQGESCLWTGSWLHVCGMVGWHRPDLLMPKPQTDSRPKSVGCGGCEALQLANAVLSQRVATLVRERKELKRRLDRCTQRKHSCATVSPGTNQFAINNKPQNIFSKMSSRGGFSLAIRRCVSGARNLGLALGMDIHRTTLLRWTIRLRAARLASMRGWYHEMLQKLEDVSTTHRHANGDEAGSNSYTIALHSMLCDATNSGVWKKTHKLHSLKVVSEFVTTPVRKDDSWSGIQAHRHHRAMMGDLQLIGKVHSGYSALSMMHKQIRSLGNRWHAPVSVPSNSQLTDVQRPAIQTSAELLHRGFPAPAIQDASDEFGAFLENVDMIDDELSDDEAEESKALQKATSSKLEGSAECASQGPTNCINMWANCTDAGSDEVKAKRLKEVYAHSLLAHWEFSADCFAHQFQLMVLLLLTFCNWCLKSALDRDYTFWGSVAKIRHCWRDKASDVYLVTAAENSLAAIEAGAHLIHPNH